MLGGSVTRVRVRFEPFEHGRLVRPFRLGAVRRADDDQLGERRLLLAAELGAVEVVAPAARGRAEADPRGVARAELEPAADRCTALVSPEVSSRAVSAPPTRS